MTELRDVSTIGEQATNRRSLGLAGVCLVLLTLPFFAGSYTLRLLISIFMGISLASSWNILGGYIGYPSIGKIAYFGIGAYTTAILVNEVGVGANGGPAFLIAALGGAIVATIIALVISPAFLRLSEHPFAIATWGFAEALGALVVSVEFLGGGFGWSMPLVTFGGLSFAQTFFYLLFGVMFLTLVTAYYLKHSNIGYAFSAIKNDEAAAMMVGIPVLRYKMLAFVASSFFVALTGALFGAYLSYFTAGTMFTVVKTIEMITITLIGGLGTFWGPVVGGVVFMLAKEFAWSYSLEWHMAITGLIVVVFALFFPQGIVGMYKSPDEARTLVRKNTKRVSDAVIERVKRVKQ